MSEEKPKPEDSPATGIVVVLGVILIIVMINKIPFFDDYSFWSKAGILLACCAGGGIVLGMAAGLMNALLKIIIDIAVGLLFVFNFVYVLFCIVGFESYVNNVAYWGLDLPINDNWLTIFIMALTIFIYNLIVIFVLLPLARIAKSTALDF